MRSAASRIFSQSSTASRTSDSTRSRSAVICLRSARSVSRSISTWIQDSTSASCGSVGPWSRRRLAAAAAGGRVEDLDQLAGDIAADDDLRVDHDVDAAALPGQLVGDRVDQERHVVGDDLDDGVAARPAVLLDGRGVHPDVRGALRAVLREPVVGESGAEDVDRVAVGEVLRGGVQVVALEEREQRSWPACPGSALGPVVPVGRCPPAGLFSATRAARASSSALASSSLVCMSSGSCRAPLRDVG